MRLLDWVVLVGSLVSIVAYGLYKSRGSRTMENYLLAGRSMPWYAMALSIMATQAGAITFISTTGQSYIDGMRLRPVLLWLAACDGDSFRHGRADLPSLRRLHRVRILEKRFDPKTRALASVIFLIERGVSVGISILRRRRLCWR